MQTKVATPVLLDVLCVTSQQKSLMTSAETFLLFSQDLPDASDLGFVDSKAPTVSVSLGSDGDELTLTQSPSLLGSAISTGTTGAVLWRISPLVANWLLPPHNSLFANGILGPSSTIVELGCGITGIVALATAPHVARYICTDQNYVLKALRQNIEDHVGRPAARSKSPVKPRPKVATKQTSKASAAESAKVSRPKSNVQVLGLDWETTVASSLLDQVEGLDEDLALVLACDCVYNSHLVQPFVQTCAELCRLRKPGGQFPAVCLVAQQLRSEDVFCEWLNAFMQQFWAWRIPETLLPEALRPGRGFVLHLGILRSQLKIQ